MSLHIHPLTSWHRAVFLLNSRTGLFVATAVRSGSKSFHDRRHPLFRSYGANLPSSLTLVSLAHLRLLASPTCVGLGTGTLFSTFRRFSRQCSHSEFSETCVSDTLRLSDLRVADLPTTHPTGFDQHVQPLAHLTLCVPPSLQQGGTGILTCPPSTTPFGLALGSD